MTVFNVAELDQALQTLLADGYQFTCGTHSWERDKPIYVRLEKKSAAGIDLTVNGRGTTFKEALDSALLNFPMHPLDGTAWKNDRLAAPVPPKKSPDVSDAEIQI